MACRAAAGNTDAGAMSSFFNMLGQMMQQGQGGQATPSGAALGIDGLSYHPPGANTFVCGCDHSVTSCGVTDRHMLPCFAGTPAPLLNDVSMQLPANSMGLIYGSSGSVRRQIASSCPCGHCPVFHLQSAQEPERPIIFDSLKC
jgi:hypothetical protein